MPPRRPPRPPHLVAPALGSTASVTLLRQAAARRPRLDLRQPRAVGTTSPFSAPATSNRSSPRPVFAPPASPQPSARSTPSSPSSTKTSATPSIRPVQKTKVALSSNTTTDFRFRDSGLNLHATVTRSDFEQWISPRARSHPPRDRLPPQLHLHPGLSRRPRSFSHRRAPASFPPSAVSLTTASIPRSQWSSVRPSPQSHRALALFARHQADAAQ